MPRPKNDPEKDPSKSAEDAANGPGQIGDAIVNGMKTMGEAADKVKNIPGSVEREAKKGVKKARKLIGLQSGGVVREKSGDLIAEGLKGNDQYK